MPIKFVWFLLMLKPFIVLADSPITCDYNGNQQQMNTCAFDDYKVSDRGLNESYTSLMQALNAKDKKVLRVSQRQWLKQRDPFCRARTEDSLGGSIHALEWYSCLKSETDLRNETLQTWLKAKKVE